MVSPNGSTPLGSAATSVRPRLPLFTASLATSSAPSSVALASQPCLQPLQGVARTVKLSQGDELSVCLAFLRAAVVSVRPVEFPLVPSVSMLVCVVLTDASFSSMSGRIGATVWCPDAKGWYFSSEQVPQWMVALFVRLQKKRTYICQFEILAAVSAYLTFPDIIAGRLVHHFLDNQPALRGLIKGGSGRPDSARLINEYSIAVLKLACRPWLGFVYSEDNLSDLPSRNDFKLLQTLKAVRRRGQLPSLVSWLSPDIPFAAGVSSA